jgi:hypothetical protein
MLDETSFVGSDPQNYEILSSTFNNPDSISGLDYTRPISTFHFAMNGKTGNGYPRLQVGRNDGKGNKSFDKATEANGVIRFGEWVRYTIVVDRAVASVNDTNTHAQYNKNGEYIKLSTDTVGGAEYKITEKVTVHLYVNGVEIQTHNLGLTGQDIGYDGLIYLGGNNGKSKSGVGYKSGIDNLVIIKRALTPNQVAGLPTCYGSLAQ